MICKDLAESDRPLTFLNLDCRLSKGKMWKGDEIGDRL